MQDWLEAEHEVDAELDRERWSYLCSALSPSEINGALEP
jgi:hypothetical protein